MVATTTRSISSLRKKIIAEHPQFQFVTAEIARWSPQENIVYYTANAKPLDLATLLHELGHALLEHRGYHQDIELITMEQAAWHRAGQLAAVFQIEFEQTIIDDHLDTYREWLHARSRCPQCRQAGVQQIGLTYRCVLCDQKWQVNDARQCRLKRYKTAT